MNRTCNHITRSFYPGGRWLYIKIYGGITTCDQLLVDVIYPTIIRLKRSNTIDDWFFIRYYDSDFHLRVRLQLSSDNNMPIALKAINRRLLPLCQDHLIYKLSIDTYERELERYGETSMELTERLFDLDSHCVCQLLKPLLCNGKGADRWRLAFVWIDAMMDALGLKLVQKWDLMKRLNSGYLNEFGYNEHNIKPLANRYRRFSDIIDKLLHHHSIDEDSQKTIKKYQIKIDKLRRTYGLEKLNMPSLLHMSMNRLFASQNRLNELVLYYCLERYYRKEVKRSNN